MAWLRSLGSTLIIDSPRPNSDQPFSTFHLCLEIRQASHERFEMNEKVGFAEQLTDLGKIVGDLCIDEDVLGVCVGEHLAVNAIIRTSVNSE